MGVRKLNWGLDSLSPVERCVFFFFVYVLQVIGVPNLVVLVSKNVHYAANNIMQIGTVPKIVCTANIEPFQTLLPTDCRYDFNFCVRTS